MTVEDLVQLLQCVSATGDGYSGCCPAHNDRNPSLSITQGHDGRILLYCHAGCTTEDIVEALDLRMFDLFTDSCGSRPATDKAHAPKQVVKRSKEHPKIVATYSYLDEKGKLLYQVQRLDPKGFRQRKPLGKDVWGYRLGDVRRVLYRLPEIINAVKRKKTIIILEGEKDVHTALKLGVKTATTNPGGAGKWKDDYSDVLLGADAVIIADNDDAGRKHAEAVAESLNGKAKRIRVLELPGLPQKGDFSDWVAEGGTLAELTALVKKCPVWHPKPEPEPKNLADLADVLGPLEWAWNSWLPNGFLTILAGESGVGKSMLALQVCASFIQGDSWPDHSKFTGDTGKVLWCETEASQALLLERARAFGLPLEHILLPLQDTTTEVQLENVGHRKCIEQLAHRDEVKLVVVDSLRGAHAGDENDSKIMAIMKWLALLARDTGKHVIVVHHLRKPKQGESATANIHRLRGSSAIVQPARMVWGLDKPDAEADVLRLAMLKSNLGRLQEPIGVKIAEDGITFCEAPLVPDQPSKLREAKDILRELLQAGPVRQELLYEQAKTAGVSRRTLMRAKAALGIRHSRTMKGYYWHFGEAKAFNLAR